MSGRGGFFGFFGSPFSRRSRLRRGSGASSGQGAAALAIAPKALFQWEYIRIRRGRVAGRASLQAGWYSSRSRASRAVLMLSSDLASSRASSLGGGAPGGSFGVLGSVGS